MINAVHESRNIMQQRNYFGKSATTVAMCTALSWAAYVAFGGQAPPQEWNILLITSDEHNAKIMGCAGHPVIQTPGMDRLAREGTMFTRAYCAVPVCAPTRQTLITGRYPEEHGQFSNAHRFDERNLTWAHHFKQHGYTTACIGKMHNNNEQFSFGFDLRLRQGEGDEEADSAIPKGRRGGGKNTLDPTEQKIYDGIADTRLRGWPVDNAEATGDGLVCNSAIQYLRKNKDRKFFLHVSMVKPHWPWNAPKDFYFMYDPQKIDLPPVIPGDLANDPVPQEEFTKFKWNEMTEAQRRLGRARYYGSLSWLDSHVKRLLETLDELKLVDKTLVIYTTDHGDMAAEKGLWLKTLMFDASARVPLLMRMPGALKPGTTNGVLINHVDLFPTLAGLVGTEKDLPANLTPESGVKCQCCAQKWPEVGVFS